MAEREARPFYIRRSLIRTGFFTGTVGGIACVAGGAWDPTSLLYSIGLLFLATSALTVLGTIISWFLPSARAEAAFIREQEVKDEAEERAAEEAEAAALGVALERPPVAAPEATSRSWYAGGGARLVDDAAPPERYVSRSGASDLGSSSSTVSYLDSAVSSPGTAAPLASPPSATPPRPPGPVPRVVPGKADPRVGSGPGDQNGLLQALRQLGVDDDTPRHI